MFHIEIMDGTNPCPAKCSTCPKPIQTVTGHSKDIIPHAYTLLQNKLEDTPFGLSFVDNFTDIVGQLDKFKVKNTINLLSTNLKLPINTLKFKEVLKEVETRFPNIDIVAGFQTRKDEISPEIISQIVEMGHYFWKTDFRRFQVSISNNSVPLKSFQDRISTMRSSDRHFFGEVTRLLNFGNATVSKKYDFIERFDYESYKSTFNMQRGSRWFHISKRMLSQISGELSGIDYYRKKAGTQAMPGEMTHENTMLTLTPMGIRINHGPYDIENPFLWMTYDELFFCLKTSHNISDFCIKLRKIIMATLMLEFDEKDFVTLDEKTIAMIAAKRKKFHYGLPSRPI